MDPPFDTSSSDSWDQKQWTINPHTMQVKRVSNRCSKSRNKPRSCKAPLVCQVEDCTNDLSGLKAYHRRYKICKYHLKVKFIDKDGSRQRFCQQCGRFHDIHEFDGSKRSCRLRLKKHNERRRKKPNNARARPESAGSGVTTSSLSIDSKLDNGEESCMFDDDYPDPETSPMASPLFSTSTQHPYMPVLPTALQRQGITTPSRVDSTSTRINDMASDSPTETTVSDPLLEVYRNFNQNCDPTEFLHAIESNEEFMPTIPEVKPLRQSSAAPLTMPLTPQVFLGQPLMAPVAFLPADRPNSKQPNYKREVHDTTPWNKSGLSSVLQDSFKVMGACGEGHRASSVGSDAESMNIARASSLPPLSATMQQMQDRERIALYNNFIKLTSLSVKLYSCTPKSLPPDLRLNLVQAVRGGLCPEGYMREGCVYLNFDIFQPRTKDTLCLDGVVERLLASPSSSFWKDTNILVQLNNDSMFVSSGLVVKRLKLGENPDLYPNVQNIAPVCVLRDARKHFSITGANLDSDANISIHCRIKGKYVAVAAVGNKGAKGSYCFSIAEDLPIGAVKVEVSKQGFIDHTMIVLSVDDDNLMAEIEAFCKHCSNFEAFLAELGLLLELRSWLMNISQRNRDATIDRIRTLLQYSFRSRSINHLSFKRCSRAEFNCLLISAQQLYAFCGREGLFCTRDQLRPLVWLAIGDVYIEKTITSILDDLCTLILVWKQLKVSTNLLNSLTRIKEDLTKLKQRSLNPLIIVKNTTVV